MRKALYLALFLVIWSVCPRGIAQTPAWTGVYEGEDLSQEPGQINIETSECGWIPVYPGNVSIVGTLVAGVTINIFGTGTNPFYNSNGTFEVIQS